MQNWKCLLVLAAFGVISVSQAQAADLPVRMPVKSAEAVAAQNWTGLYIGANAGWGKSHADWFFAGPGALGNEGGHDAKGGLAGGQIGYNLQFANWVFGVEAQGDWTRLTGSNTSAVFAGFTNSTTVKALGLFTGRVGYAWANTLLYVKGGAAVVRDHFDFAGPGVGGTGYADETRWGETAGVGLEYGFAPNWSVGIEYDHLFLRRTNVSFVSAAPANDNIGQSADIVTARLNYRFGGFGF